MSLLVEPSVEPVVSVVIPMHDARKYVGECLRSVLAQSYSRLDVVVVDDGSTDGGGDVVAAVSGSDERVRMVRTANRGPASARDKGLDAARGEWVVFVDADDWVAPTYVETLLVAALAHGADMAVCGLWRACADGLHELPVTSGPPETCCATEAVRRFLVGGIAQVFPVNKVSRMTLFRDGGIRFPQGRLFEDAATVYRLMGAASRVVYLPELLYFYRQRPDSLVRQQVDADVVRDALTMLGEVSAFVEERYPGLAAEMVAFQVAHRMHLLYRLVRQGGDPAEFEPIADWLRHNVRLALTSRFVAWRAKLMVVVMAFSPRVFQFAARGVRGRLSRVPVPVPEEVRARG